MYANFYTDKERLIEYLRSGNVEVSDYLIANPFSELDNQDIDGAVNEPLFFESFFSLSYKKYEIIAKILGIAESRRKNTVFLTGYRGCGKTTLANYLKRLIIGPHEAQLPEIKFKEYPSSDNMDLNESLDDIELHDIKELFAHFKVLYSIFKKKVPCDGIELDNNEQLMAKNKDVQFLTKQINMYKDYINKNILGKPIYLDFEVGTSEYKNSIDQKLNSYLKEIVIEMVDKKLNKSVGEILGNIFSAFGLTTLEKKDSFYMKGFFDFVQDTFMLAGSGNAIRDKLNDVIKPLALDQLLSLIVFVEWAIMENYQTTERLYFIFDNLDTIHDPRILNRLMSDFASFLRNTAKFLRSTGSKKIFTKTRSLHNDVCFIFIMRDTSQMNIVDHFYERLSGASSHFDVSNDVNKKLIVNKKNKFLKEGIRQDQKNDAINYLILGTEKIENILNDAYVRENISPMFNNDYKRMVECLTQICKDNPRQVDEYISMMDASVDKSLADKVDAYQKQGARGILFRLIFNHFQSQGYFDLMHVSVEQTNQVHYTVARFILLYLHKKQFEHNDEFMTNDNGRIPVSELLHMLDNIPANTGTIHFDEIINALRGMYALRNAPSWGHLITYDSSGSTSDGDFQDKNWMNIIDRVNKDGNDVIVNIRITCAGRSYVRFMASHFELYACRFCEKNTTPLFSSTNEHFNDREDKYTFERILERVCSTVEQLCNNMDIFVKEYIKMCPDLAYDDNILNRNDFIYIDRNIREESYKLFHEERYIHQHISYIDSYRMYIINKKWDCDHAKAIDINKRILKIIERYIRLLKKYEYFSPVSKNLYIELNACYNYIVEVMKYNCNDVGITKSSYSILKDKGFVND